MGKTNMSLTLMILIGIFLGIFPALVCHSLSRKNIKASLISATLSCIVIALSTPPHGLVGPLLIFIFPVYFAMSIIIGWIVEAIRRLIKPDKTDKKGNLSA
jgi:hypothetical protein